MTRQRNRRNSLGITLSIFSCVLLLSGCQSGLSDNHLTLTSDVELSMLNPLSAEKIRDFRNNGTLPTALIDVMQVNAIVPPTQPNDRYVWANSLAYPMSRDRLVQTIPGLPPDPQPPVEVNIKQRKVTLPPIQELRTTNPQHCLNIVGFPYSFNPHNTIPTPQIIATTSFFGIEYYQIHEDLFLFPKNSDAESVFTTVVTTKQKCPGFRLRSADGLRTSRILLESKSPRVGDKSISYVIADQRGRHFTSTYHIGYVLCGPILLRIYTDSPAGTFDKELPKLMTAATKKLLK